MSPAQTLRRHAAPVLAAAALLAGAAPGGAQQKPTDTADFTHAPHRKITCVSCHATRGTEVGPVNITAQQCQSCHHQAPVAGACTGCHARSDLSERVAKVQKFRLSTGGTPVSRTVLFGHGEHGGLECRSCHPTDGRMAMKAASCNGCHAQHHAPEANCRSCHESGRDGAHDAAVHVGCDGSGCHAAAPVKAAARTRELCLTCHTDREQHRPKTNCVECHALPDAMARVARP